MSGLRKLYVRSRIRLALALARPDESVRATSGGRPHVFVALAADYGNVGDLAITRAQVRFLEQAFPDAVVEPIPISRTLPAIKRLRRVIGEHDVVALIGGGNTGDLYDDIQYLRELVVAAFPDTPTISFPQTVEFSETRYGRWAARRARRVYNRHGRLAVMARDSRSHELATRMFPGCEVVLAPDVVLTVDATGPETERSGVVLALRSDLEQALDDAGRQAAQTAAAEVGPVRHRDTHVGDVRLDRAEADAVLEDYWRDWRSASVVVTDRLHGTIFSVVTGTPCLALDSGTGKVSQFYRDWLTDHPGVVLVPSIDRAALVRVSEDIAGADEARGALARIFAERFDWCRAAVDVP